MQSQNVGGVLLSLAVPFARWLQTRNSSTRLFIGGLSSHTNEPVLKDAFGKYGEIIEVRVICHSESGNSKGYGFVQFTSETAASTALKEMMGTSLDGRNICVEYANKDPNRENMD